MPEKFLLDDDTQTQAAQGKAPDFADPGSRLTLEDVENAPLYGQPNPLDPFAPPTQSVGFDAAVWLKTLSATDPSKLGLNFHSLPDPSKVAVAEAFPAHSGVLSKKMRASLRSKIEGYNNDTLQALVDAEAKYQPPGDTTLPATDFEAILRGKQSEEGRNVEWVVGPYIPKGFLTILGGATGAGKSQLALWFAAKAWHLSQHRTIYVQGEDPIKHMTIPRIQATRYAGKPLPLAHNEDGAIFYWDSKEHGPFKFDNEEGFEGLFTFARKLRYSMIILDPLLAFHARGVRSNNAEQMREMLEPIKDMAEEYEIAVLICAHISKGTGQYINPLNIIRGSSDLAAISRSILYAGQHPNNEPEINAEGEVTNRLNAFGHVKNNVGKLGATFAYEFESVEVDCGGVKVSTSRVNVMPDPDEEITIFDLVNANMRQIKKAEAEARDKGKASPKAQQAVEEVYEHLSIFDGTFAKDMQESMAAKHGITRDTLRKALASDPRFMAKSGSKGGFHLPPVSE